MNQKIKLYRLLFLFTLNVIVFPLLGLAQGLNVKPVQLPLLLDRPANPVARLAVSLPAKAGLSDLEIEVSGGAEKYLKGFSLLLAEGDSAVVSEAKMKKYAVLGRTGATGKQRKLSFKSELPAGTSYLWLTAELDPSTPLSAKIGFRIKSLKIGGRSVRPASPASAFVYRPAVAVRRHQQENVHTHRIPGLATATDGTLLSIYDARYTKAGDLQGHIDIGVSRSFDKGRTWQPMQVALDMGTWGGLPEKFNGVSDACILVDKTTGTIFIAGLWMHGVINSDGKWLDGLNENSTDWNHQWRDKGSQPGFGVRQTSQFLITKSTDHGKTWSKPVNLTQMCKKEAWWLWAPAPGQGITLKDGTLVFPTQGRDHTGKAFSNITYSKDGGKTWETSEPAVRESTTENMAVELSDGSIMLNMRSNANRGDTSANNGRAVAVTRDLGTTWTEHESSHRALIEPTCMASIIRHDYVDKGIKKSILVFCNPDSKTARNNISIKVSYDDGKTWPRKILLDQEKSRGYSCLTSVSPGVVGVLYESSQADLAYQQLELKELLK
ncbi:sialidase [Pedobacter yulinensis]|uniref:exo-alpha-sialidase n=1 Tax=Pedobacter yulinensis TaxID=2126353 RepID=A0A2T3HN63_9SPHI|nr:sialidase family protein [Pedobacter yulinensis]PST83866.1 sialidase [Pedobacter yulinensis]